MVLREGNRKASTVESRLDRKEEEKRKIFTHPAG